MNVKLELYSIVLENTMAWDCKTKEKFIAERKKYEDVGFIILGEWDAGEEGRGVFNLVTRIDHEFSK